jgi:VWFA-related protein
MRIAVGVLAAFALAAGLAAQQPPAPRPQATFRGGVTSVEVDAYVTDAKGDPVAGLTANDFELIDAGWPQRIATFVAVNLPIARDGSPAAAAAAIRQDAGTSITNTTPEGRIYLVVLDDLHIDGARTAAVRTAMRRFIEQDLGPADVTAIVSTSGRAGASAEFTTDRRRLVDITERFLGQKLPSATLSHIQTARDERIQEGFKNGPQKKKDALDGFGPDPDGQERVFRAQKTMAALRRLSDFMAGVTGRRKAMVLVSEGVDVEVDRAISDRLGDVEHKAPVAPVMVETQAAIRAANRGNVTVYAVDPRGLADAAADLIETTTSFGPVGNVSTQDEMRISHDSLRVLAENTGGFAALDHNDLSSAFDRIVRESSTYYVLGFSPVNAAPDGRYHRLTVKVRRPGLRVTSRPGYFAARPGDVTPGAPARPANAAIQRALASPSRIADIPLTTFAAASKGPGVAATIVIGVEIDASRLDFAEKNGTWSSALDLAVDVTDASGRDAPFLRNTINLAMTPAELERVRTRGLRVITQGTLTPGAYQVHLAVADTNGKAGSVLESLDVPDFSSTPLALSDVTLTSMSAGDVPTTGNKDPRLPAPPVAAREFARSEAVVVAGEIYEAAEGQSHTVIVLTQLRQAKRVITTSTGQFAANEQPDAADRHWFTSTIPLSDVEPGTYTIHVEARTSDGRPPASRDVEIRVR